MECQITKGGERMEPFLNWLHRPNREFFYILAYHGGKFLPPKATFYLQNDAVDWVKRNYTDHGYKRFKIKEQDHERFPPNEQFMPPRKIVTKWMRGEDDSYIIYLVQSWMQGDVNTDWSEIDD